ncbi:trehalase isoform X1 [Tribolium castaneum]|uniref:Trehalase n=3 Tax=Tribolium castaneum TaxID=7070 RepID=D6W851_TRICA|nr:PREDICTED: trehalase isoform X1 [Tribolium castaneum]XP_008200737.1 PREDICTED: trehalase isoform X1 [Tribolium castaneum]XP_008200738.1 PREDICTED: trehalase isoform X1 [Tribolium castaneum]EFA11183.1 Trehalase-like Protein [Tribolium castaneum]|eukprot:XP_008200736.1 PREDICTED: trehalase isoform X1 [Tribolium castaneum]
MNKLVCCAFVLSLALSCICDDTLSPPCNSDIYCYGPLLHTIQMERIYEDSKTFVDMKMRFEPNITLIKFNEFMVINNNKPSKNATRAFVNENFEPAGQEFEEWDPEDWVKHPKYIDGIQDDEFKQWALSLNLVWKDLGRKMKKEVELNQSLYSIIWVPHPVIVPGGRFREFYYWDSYWIVQGLLLSEMYGTVKGMLENFLYIVDKYGHIPNGGRIYYMQRSQPPLMVPMIKLYVDFTNDTHFVRDNIATMEKEFEYWITKHNKTVTLDGKNYTLATYGDRSKGPRPESYSEDVEGAAIFDDNDKKESFYAELKAAAESGWDFSSRWFIKNATNKGNLTNTKIRSIVPVDLNAMIYWNAVLLSEFNTLLGNLAKVQYYNNIAKEWMEAVTAVLWHEEVGAWLDYDLSNSVKRDYFYPTNIAPLWTGCYNQTDKGKIVRLVLKYLQNKNILYPGGIPTTVEHTGEQWDYPNAWPPLQHIMIVGLNNTGDVVAQRLAFEIAEKWVRSNYKAFKETDAMFEKYDATVPGGHGGGGEYETQLGFGWTNGIIMDLLYRYSGNLTVEDPPPPSPKPVFEASQDVQSASSFSQISAVLIALMISLTAGFIGVCIYKRRNQQQTDSRKAPRPSRARYTELRSIPRRAKSTR